MIESTTPESSVRRPRMTLFERGYVCAEPFMLPLYGQVRARLNDLVRASAGRARILDVGGRKSHYTVALPSDVCVTDLPRRSALQERLHIGVTRQMIDQTLARRTNVRWIVFDDMTRSSLRSRSFDVVVAVEVLEHIERDADFLTEVARILKPGGVFLMTTPNGNSVENTNPDHKRHYTAEHLARVLHGAFADVTVEFAVLAGPLHRWGLASWTRRHPWRTGRSMMSNWMNARLSRRAGVSTQALGTCHLLATARTPVRRAAGA